MTVLAHPPLLATNVAPWRVELVQTGRLQTHEHAGKPRLTAIYKTPHAAVQVEQGSLVGDEHTGDAPDLDRAVCFHPLLHYAFWRAYFRREIPIGFFGENITLTGLAEEDLCVGDVIRCGTTLFQVTQPRIPCYKQAYKMGVPNFVKLLIQTGKVGFLARVLQPGTLQVSDAFALVERPHPEANLAFVHRILYSEKEVDAARELAQIAPLAHDWKAKFAQRAG